MRRGSLSRRLGSLLNLFYGTEEDYILTEFENENGTPSDMGIENESVTLGDTGVEFLESGSEGSDDEALEKIPEENDRSADGKNGADYTREEYERLIKTAYKDFYAEDTQRLINKRFKKYKALEERVKSLEADAERYADVERLISEERERAVNETEERMNRQFLAMRSRGEENAVSKRSQRHSPDVSGLTKSERAHLASRALMGEKIKL